MFIYDMNMFDYMCLDSIYNKMCVTLSDQGQLLLQPHGIWLCFQIRDNFCYNHMGHGYVFRSGTTSAVTTYDMVLFSDQGQLLL